MLVLVHAAVGAACGIALRRRLPAAVVAFASHYALDAIGHDEPLDEGGNLRPDVIAVDAGLLGVVLLATAARRGIASPETLGAVAACIPDVEPLLRRRLMWPRGGTHGAFPHGRWPRQKMSLRWQLVIGVMVWLAVLGPLSSCSQAQAPRVAPR
jgi:hypothetical protein